VEHRRLVQLVRDADELVASGAFALGRAASEDAWELPWKNSDAVTASVTRGVRQTATFLTKHPASATAESQEPLVARAAELAGANVALRAEFDWRRRAWEQLAALPANAAPAELTGVVSEAFAQSLGALGALCYVRSDDGTSAEGTFWCDTARPIHSAIEVGAGAKAHDVQIVAKLRPTWQRRPYQTIDLSAGESSIAHVLVWFDEFGPTANDEVIREVTTLCTHWLAQAVHVAELESQLESLTAALRDQAAQSDAQLEDAKLAALAEMAAGAGHEINNPLAVISGRAQLLLAEETDPRRRKSLETIMAQAQRIHCMIVDLMMFARPPAPDSKPTSIGEAIDRAVAKLRAEADDAEVTLGVAAIAELPLVNGDAGQLATAIECVIRNAIEASPAGSTVHVRAAAGTSNLCVSVIDSGAGISDEQRQHIFEPFYSGRDAGRGLGMGLSKAWKLVQNHGGEIQVASGPNGTTVTVILPALVPVTTERACGAVA
jgi:signal transduction histidine kinase